MFSDFESAPHFLADVVSPVFHGCEAVFDLLQLFCEDVHLHLVALWDADELFVAHDNAVVVVVFCSVEELFSVAACVVAFFGEEDACLRICCLVCLCDGADVGFESDDDRFVAEVESFHFVCGDAHDECFSASYFVVADSSAVEEEHPYAVFLAVVDFCDAVFLL